MRFLRRRPDPESELVRARFDAVAIEVERAQRALLSAIPTARDAGMPLGQALAAFRSRLEAAERAMAGWRDPSLDHEWTKCERALRGAREEAERLRLEPQPPGFEALNARVGDVLHPLEAFVDVERALRRK